MVGSQRVTDDLPDGGRVGLGHVLRAVERSGRWAHGVGWEREPLKEVTIKCYEVLLEERITSEEVIIQGELQERTARIEAVVGQAMALSHQDETHLEHECMLAEAGPEAIAYEAMLKKSEAAGNLAEPLGTQGTFFNHDAPPSP